EIPPNEKIGFYLTCARYERIFHTSISGPEAEEILRHDGKIGSYLVRESLSSPGTFVISVRSTDDKISHIKLFFDVRVVLYRNAVSGFSDEFEKLQSHPSQFESVRCFAGKSEENINKNRYKNIVANDRTRVYLEGDPPPGHTDYINANYIKKTLQTFFRYHCLLKVYICTQGCLPNTVDDFWEMVWQQNSRIIVMITKEVEKNKVRLYINFTLPLFCLREEYFFQTFFAFRISVVVIGLEEQKRDFVFRTFEMKDTEAECSRTIYQFQYMTWPDHGCPNNPLDLINFRNEVRNCEFECRQGEPWGPWVVHCSAGIGRGGVFLVIDIMTDHIEVDPSLCYVNIFRTVLMLRDQRAGIIQSDLQYRFIYQALDTYLSKFHHGFSVLPYTS
ncbi:unnamed protein product, partial [Enterobius vermicularis]|uniref:protein-tyrosine-phosphatase n=1 Tax=Enterobius vermicularis TaxID=51028 RepID=A0A0N4V8R7_ENTVE